MQPIVPLIVETFQQGSNNYIYNNEGPNFHFSRPAFDRLVTTVSDHLEQNTQEFNQAQMTQQWQDQYGAQNQRQFEGGLTRQNWQGGQTHSETTDEIHPTEVDVFNEDGSISTNKFFHIVKVSNARKPEGSHFDVVKIS